MRVYDERIPEELYGEFLSQLPQMSVELFLEHEGRVLLARRTNKPLKGERFWPGSRLRKGGELPEAAHRVAREELGMINQKFSVVRMVFTRIRSHEE